MWSGSTFIKSFLALKNSPEARILNQSFNTSKSYDFNYNVYINSCSLRFYSQTTSTFALAISYTLVIHIATQ